ncbi:MAG: PASTA domain-containing protein [Flavobacteriales bacterium]|uniref:PASTA domain-containing protein n=1 Tax=Candidatus Ulvibacter alkanivorans TaxID=2267620 RepID=UPI000DF1B002|nr:PASTA domain-containing protein [Candidatus Ulvibacter alkanivorans]MCH2491147.1 PASTA domain-containing protein [Flavobacteriales bacterium]
MTFFKFLTTKAFLKQLLYAVVVLIVLSFLVLWWLKGTTNHGERIEVPNLATLSLDKVEEVLNEQDLRYEVMDSANYNPEFPKFSVIEQIPKAGKMVKEDRKIYLTLNPSGYRKINVPDVLGKTLRQAEPTLLATGFKIGKISKRPHISDQVLEMRYKGEKLEAGTELQKTAVIDLIVGDGSRNRVQDTADDDPQDTSETTNDDNDGL